MFAAKKPDNMYNIAVCEYFLREKVKNEHLFVFQQTVESCV